MSIKDIFFGEKNIQLLAKLLGDELNIDNTKTAKKACRDLLVSQMELVFKKNKEKLVRADPIKILPKLNDKSVKEALKIYNEHINNRPVTKRPAPKKKPEFRGMPEGFSGSDFAPVSNGDGEFITATGEIGKKMFFGNLNDQLLTNNRMANQDDLERQILLKKAEYDNGEDMYGIGLSGMSRQNNRQPDEPNFCLDGGDTRSATNGAIDNNQSFNPMNMNPKFIQITHKNIRIVFFTHNGIGFILFSLSRFLS